jgi:uncharacterized protein (TIGR02996 family)
MNGNVTERIGGPEQLAELLERPDIEQVKCLFLHLDRAGRSRADEVARLAAQSSRLGRLRGFGILGSGMTDEGARLLAGSPHLANLRLLHLYDNRIGDEGVAALAASPYLGQVRSLDLTQNVAGDRGLIELAHSTTLKSLRRIQIYGNKHTDRAVRALARGSLASQLRDLWVGGGRVTWRGAQAIARSPALLRLRSLDLNNTSIGDAGLIEIVHSPYLRRLRELYLRRAELTDASVAVLARSPKARRLRHLDLECNAIGDVGTWELVRSPHLEQLEQLKLWDCDDLQTPVCLALKSRFGTRVEVHIGDPEEDAAAMGVQWPGSTTADVLLDDIRHYPDDDTPRLVYADWIEEEGDPERANFIRAQCRLARCEPDDPVRAALTDQVKEALNRHGWDWTEGAFLRWLQHPAGHCPIDQPHGVCEVFAEAGRLRQEEQTKGKKGAAARQRAWLKLESRLETLKWGGSFARLPFLSGCEFERGFIEHAWIEEVMFLIFAPAVRDLGMVRKLNLFYATDDLDAGDRIIRHLIATMERPRLRTLDLGTALLQMPPLRALAAWRGTEELTELTSLLAVGDDMEGDQVVRTLARSRWLRNLEVLEVDCEQVCTDAAVEEVLTSPYLGKLKRLILNEPALSDEMAERYLARFDTEPPGE